jgi:hypothetical protein
VHVDLLLLPSEKTTLQKYRQFERGKKKEKEKQKRKRRGNAPKCKTHVSPDEIRRRKKLQKSQQKCRSKGGRVRMNETITYRVASSAAFLLSQFERER